MFDKLKSALNSSNDKQNISPADVARDVATLHDTLDEFKLWSTETVEWLEEEQRRIDEEGDAEYVSEIDDLIAYVQSIFFRIEYGDYAIEQATEDLEDDENAADSVDAEAFVVD